jgi:hypothetical protein
MAKHRRRSKKAWTWAEKHRLSYWYFPRSLGKTGRAFRTRQEALRAFRLGVKRGDGGFMQRMKKGRVKLLRLARPPKPSKRRSARRSVRANGWRRRQAATMKRRSRRRRSHR